MIGEMHGSKLETYLALFFWLFVSISRLMRVNIGQNWHRRVFWSLYHTALVMP